MATGKKKELNIYFADESIGFFQGAPKAGTLDVYGHVEMASGIIDNGFIVDPERLLAALQDLFRQYRLKPKRIRMILNSQNVLMREVDIEKNLVKPAEIAAYVDGELGKSLHFPFPVPRTSNHLIGHEGDKTRILVVGSDDKLLNDYLDVFDRLHVREVAFDLPALCLYSLFSSQSEVKYESLMQVTVYNTYFTIKIFEKDFPIFNLVEEFEAPAELSYDLVDNFVERVANYYRYNMHHGERAIDNVLFVNLGASANDARFESVFAAKPFGLPYKLFKFPEQPESNGGWTRSSLIAYAASFPKTGNLENINVIDFRLDRPDRRIRIAHRLLTVAFLVFSLVSMVYIPFHTTNEDIYIQENVNANLAQRVQDLEAEAALLPSFTQKERNYSNAYDALVAYEFSVSTHILDLVNMLGTDVVLTNYDVATADREIVLILVGTSITALNEYLIAIYEAYGITGDGTDPERWMDGFPAFAFVASDMIEVTIHHA